MRLYLEDEIEHILILGAGASVDYGLPVWSDLDLLIKEKISKDEANYQYKKEMLNWIDKVGKEKEKKYDTIDECIAEESMSQEYLDDSEQECLDGSEIENQMFRVIKDIFNEAYKKDAKGWIRVLNEKILKGKERLERKIAFINYNYDDVLDKNFLIFSYLPLKLQRYNKRERLNTLSKVIACALYPHGCFFSKQELENTPHIKKHIDTMKSHDEKHLDVVSCYESKTHVIEKYDHGGTIKLYLLGLGGGLKINLNSIKFKIPISEIHVTIKDNSMKDKVMEFLSKEYKIPKTEINVYTTCEELVEKCFNSQ